MILQLARNNSLDEYYGFALIVDSVELRYTFM
jgi:hypothetical protein